MEEVLVDGSVNLKYDNRIIAPSGLINIKVRFYGKNNLVVISPHAKKLKNLTIEFTTDDGIVLIGDSNLFGTIRVGYKSKVIIGDKVTSTSPVYFTCAETTQITIGDDCMFATNNQIRTDDAHAIYDIESGNRINYSKNITIGAHVWVSYNAVIFGGTEINMGSIVGYSSFVKGKFPNNSIIIGSPAKISKKNISWERPNVLWAREEFKDSSSIKDKIYWDKTKLKSPIFLGDGCSYLLSNIESYPILDTDKPYFSLDFICLNAGLLFIRGNALMTGVECYDYNQAYKYSLILKTSDDEYVFNLGKMSDPFITKKVFDGRHISYNKSKFTTLKNEGINLNGIPSGDYKISVKMVVNGDEYYFNPLDYLNEAQKRDISEPSFKIKDGYLILSL
ncbi:acyltransferase [Acinetobacter lanii]|uniref:Acyltransferase n=1 Tax=Acinetobacter lanii TaxID=2715163 RepID=A0A6G8S7V3_9GAMM|nr:acyltransferase [Acinetobacter lanii]QIO10171.1 acyltransferase [Acinetobacter lanii]